MVGRKVVSENGRVLGTVHDVLIDERDGRIVGYSLSGEGIDEKLKALLPSMQEHAERRNPYLRAEANLRAGKDLIVAPEDAVAYNADAVDESAFGADAPAAANARPAGSWRSQANPSAEAARWVRDSEGGFERLNRETREQ